MKEVKIYNELYYTQINYLIGGTVKDLIKFLKRRHKDAKYWSWDKEVIFDKNDITTDAYQFHVITPIGDVDVFYVWMHEVTPDLIFHETEHLVGDIMFTRCVPYTYESEETYAYLGGWIFKKIFKLLK